MRRLAAAAALVAALAVTGAASAHVTISPPFVEAGVATLIAFATPNERPPHATVLVGVTAPPGISVVAASAPAGWSAKIDGRNVTWSGGRIDDRNTVSFPIRVLAKVRAGTSTFTSAQTYDDGAVVRWQATLSVLPASGAAAPNQHPWGAIGAALIGIVVIGGSLVGVRLLRRRPLQER